MVPRLQQNVILPNSLSSYPRLDQCAHNIQPRTTPPLDPSSSPGRLSPGPLSPDTLPDRPLPDRPGLQSCEGPGASNTTKNSTRRPPEKGKQNGNLGGRKKKKKKREILGLKQNRSTPVTPTLDQSHDGPQAGPPLSCFDPVAVTLLLLLLLLSGARCCYLLLLLVLSAPVVSTLRRTAHRASARPLLNGTSQHFALLFSFSRLPIPCFSPFWGSSRGILAGIWAFPKCWGIQNAHLELSRHLVKPRRSGGWPPKDRPLVGSRGVSHDGPEGGQTCIFEGAGKTPRKGNKN